MFTLLTFDRDSLPPQCNVLPARIILLYLNSFNSSYHVKSHSVFRKQNVRQEMELRCAECGGHVTKRLSNRGKVCKLHALLNILIEPQLRERPETAHYVVSACVNAAICKMQCLPYQKVHFHSSVFMHIFQFVEWERQKYQKKKVFTFG